MRGLVDTPRWRSMHLASERFSEKTRRLLRWRETNYGVEIMRA